MEETPAKMPERVVGYGDPECSNGCPNRVGAMTLCVLMTIATQIQMACISAGCTEEACAWQRKQIDLASKVKCAPGLRRI